MNDELNKKYPYMEMAAMPRPGEMHRGHFVRQDDEAAVQAFCKRYKYIDVFASISRYAEPSPKAAHYTPLVFDIDSADLTIAQKQTVNLERLLSEHLGLEPPYLQSFFSGSKGFHIGVPQYLWGVPPDPIDIVLFRHLARRLHKDGITALDRGIYQANRLLRLPNTINSKSGLYDIALAWEEVRDYGIDTIREMARQPREETNMAAVGDCPRAGAWLIPTRKWAVNLERQPQPNKRTASSRDGWSYRHCIRQIEREAILPDGGRHATYFALSQFYASIGMSSEEIEFRLNEIDARNPIRDGDTYIPRVAANAHKYSSEIRQCPHPAFEQFCDPGKCCLFAGGSDSR